MEQEKMGLIPTSAEEDPQEGSFHFYNVAELEAPMQKILHDMPRDLPVYEYIIGDDASGRIPALTFQDVLKNIYAEQEIPKPELYFIAGSGRGRSEIEQSEKKTKLEKYISEFYEKNGNGKNGRVLLVTDHISSGGSLTPLVQILQQHGVNFDIASISVDKGVNEKKDRQSFERSLGENSKLFFGQDYAPSIYNRPELSGVSKHEDDVLAKPYYENGSLDSEQNVKKTREDVKLLANKLFKWRKATSQS